MASDVLGSTPEMLQCSHCTSWGPDDGCPCCSCDAVWPQGTVKCAAGLHLVSPRDAQPGMCVHCDRGEPPHGE
jgi:hypothetical protein